MNIFAILIAYRVHKLPVIFKRQFVICSDIFFLLRLFVAVAVRMSADCCRRLNFVFVITL